mmetsp:Transcript_16537/g.28948  ORF Transcript_16537/g.28948 Transcript_16537/m.28948 type:complete len:379 (-) Transcript_16537:423-1559(-)|eukprot:CAMPEP_0184695348 /NCGR_PEP_ID=MMETSP0313-20130426/3008_1 /TAXON_ID=2792 /ORGANISM="Porphyridium aerugineum, Strain SAG 1380-2" /LENGTH=378 /DNA_ID=CAMNT_0027153783 /DNA_START=89 /DNA_END=1225 /DNA_ORIENTATION=-
MAFVPTISHNAFVTGSHTSGFVGSHYAKHGTAQPSLAVNKRARMLTKSVLYMSSLSSSPLSPLTAVTEPPAEIIHGFWTFRGFKVAYSVAGMHHVDKPRLLCVHGFGASSGHFKETLQSLGKDYQVYAICLLGFGRSEKPIPGTLDNNMQPIYYSFETWSQQIREFCDQVIGAENITLVANSIGAVAALQACVDSNESKPNRFGGLVQLDTSLRMLNVKKRGWISNIMAPTLQNLLKIRPIGELFFSQIQNEKTLRRILEKAYHVKSAVDPELIEMLQEPAKDPNALDVFLAFISYDVGPVPEDLIPLLRIPSLIIWGEKDTFEPLEPGRKLGELSDKIVDFVVLPNVGHCPMDEAPELVNPLIDGFVQKHVVGTTRA